MYELIKEIVIKRGGKITFSPGELGVVLRIECGSCEKHIGQVFHLGDILNMAKWPDEILIGECRRIAKEVVKLEESASAKGN